MVMTENGEASAVMPGRFRNAPGPEASLPAIGDWVAIDASQTGATATVQAVLPRKSKFSRNAAGQETREQVLAANIDHAFIVCSLNCEINPNRIQRYLVSVYDSGAMPVVLLNKEDLCPDPSEPMARLGPTAATVPVHLLSAATGRGFETLGQYLTAGRTGVFLGSSGVGKSTIINRLLGHEAIRVAETSNYKDRGRHTTTGSELYFLGTGGMVIDTPGLRELQLWDGRAGLPQAFPDIEELACLCRFSDCRHDKEPGCAVRGAVDQGKLDSDRHRSYQKLQRELKFHQRQQDVRLRIEEARRWRSLSKKMRHNQKGREL